LRADVGNKGTCPMPIRHLDDEDDLDDSEYPDEPDDDEDDDETVPCPHCFRSVYEGAERCPGCGSYLSREDAPRGHPWWVVVGVLVCLVVVLRWIVL
jgi:hypothetical protein